MRIWRHHLYSDELSMVSVGGDKVVIGRHPGCDVVLPSAFVADRALSLEWTQDRWEVLALGTNGCKLSGFRLGSGQRATLDHGDEIQLAPFVLRIDLSEADDNANNVVDDVDCQISDLLRTIHSNLLEVVSPEQTESAKSGSTEALLHVEHVVEELTLNAQLEHATQTTAMRRLAGEAVRGRLVDRIIGAGAKFDPLKHSERPWATLVSAAPEREEDFERLADHISQSLGLRTTATVTANMANVERGFWQRWNEVDLLHDTYLYLALREVKKQLKDLVFGYGPIEDLLRLPTITEIMVVRHDEIYVERKSSASGGSIERSGRRFVSEAAALAVIERIVQLANRQIDQARPMVDARLDDGSRINAVIAPVAISGPTLTIRKAPKQEFTMADWNKTGLSDTAAKFLEASVRARRSVLVIGGTGSGKTTLLNCLTEWIPSRERLVVIEDTAELQLRHSHVVQLQSKPGNVENAGEIRIRDLVRNALRMRPDRIVIGECRGAEAIDMLQAMNTGHNGSMTTLHANSAEESIERLEVMVKTGMDLPIDAIQRQIAAAIDVIVEVAHEYDEKEQKAERRIFRISEVREVDDETGRVQIRALYELHPTTEGKRLLPTGRIPAFVDELVTLGLFDLDCFLYRESTAKGVKQ